MFVGITTSLPILPNTLPPFTKEHAVHMIRLMTQMVRKQLEQGAPRQTHSDKESHFTTENDECFPKYKHRKLPCPTISLLMVCLSSLNDVFSRKMREGDIWLSYIRISCCFQHANSRVDAPKTTEETQVEEVRERFSMIIAVGSFCRACCGDAGC